ncbi:MAG: Unknown protein [uncultured Thiotrichaceae bacterium]|uniref:DUF5615 domain-containing protein n=1 Tax=uncultured Thiotrichaceae bacterium TaxID=298394 RepID=A0A6S6SDS4_9GAMM|nr:MAG: Unknown protein [uncultured Thiotrichaceae bacterium]
MKLLLDENLSRRIVPALQDQYPDSSQVALEGLESHDDRELWAYAQQHGYILVTQDSDFHEMSVLNGFPPKVVWLKCGNQPKNVIKSKLLDNAAEIKQFNDDEVVGCIEIY